MPTATKVDYKRELRELYRAGREPAMVDGPELAFLMIDRHGDPNTSVEYREAIEALYAIAYGAKFAVKLGPDGSRLRRDAARGALVGERHEHVHKRQQVRMGLDRDDHAA